MLLLSLLWCNHLENNVYVFGKFAVSGALPLPNYEVLHVRLLCSLNSHSCIGAGSLFLSQPPMCKAWKTFRQSHDPFGSITRCCVHHGPKGSCFSRFRHASRTENFQTRISLGPTSELTKDLHLKFGVSSVRSTVFYSNQLLETSFLSSVWFYLSILLLCCFSPLTNIPLR